MALNDPIEDRRGAVRRGILWVGLPIALITALHYGTMGTAEDKWIHDILRRMYYLPLVLAAFQGGLRGALIAAAVVTAVYAPHAFSHFAHQDPADNLEKSLEIILYFSVAGVAGFLVDRERRGRQKTEALAVRLQSALDEREHMAQQLIRSGRLEALGQLTAGLAHEIKNPLHAMRGTAEIVLDELSEGPEREMQARHIGEIDRLSDLLERFLSFARPTTAELREMPLFLAVRRALDLISAQARRDDISVKLMTPAWRGQVNGDFDQLVQLFLGLIINATQSLTEIEGDHRVEVTLETRADRTGTWHGVHLMNNGPPLPAGMEEKIFDPFVTTRPEGTGLGLAVACRIVDSHGGLLEAKNSSDGVVFSVWLPAYLGEPS